MNFKKETKDILEFLGIDDGHKSEVKYVEVSLRLAFEAGRTKELKKQVKERKKK